MFITRKRYEEDIFRILKSLESLKEAAHKHDFISCEKCGCLVEKKDAVKGVPTIRTIETLKYQKSPGALQLVNVPRYVVDISYYCRAHAPKNIN